MRVPGGDRAVDNVLRRADGDEWELRRGLVFDAHAGMLLADLEMDVEDPVEEPGTHAPAEQAARSREALERADRVQIALLTGLFVLVAAMLSAGTVAYTALSSQLLDMQLNMH